MKNPGKVGPLWDAEPFVVLETLGEKYRVCPEEGGDERLVHRSALKVCVTHQQVPARPEPEPVPNVAGPAPQPRYVFPRESTIFR